MTTETMQTTAATTTEGQAASTTAAPDAAAPATAAEAQGTQQQTQQKPPEQAQVAPEQYEFKAPEGREFSPEVISAFAKTAKELNLSQEHAQKVIDDLGPALAAREEAVAAAAKEKWATDAKSDKEFGGAALDENLGVAQKAIKAFGTPELRQLLDDSGLGNHPEVIRFFFRAGKAISEDRFVSGSTTPPAPQSVAQRMYPEMNP